MAPDGDRPDLLRDPEGESSYSGYSGRIRLVVLFGGQSAEHDVSCVSARHVLAAIDPSRYDVEPVGITRDGTWVRAEAAAEILAAGQRSGPARDLADRLPAQLLAEGPPIDALPMLASSHGTGVVPSAAPTDDVPTNDVPTDGAPTDDGAITVVLPVLHGPMGEDGTVQGLLELAGVPYVGAGVLASALCMDKVAAKDHLRAHGLAQADYRGILVDTRSAGVGSAHDNPAHDASARHNWVAHRDDGSIGDAPTIVQELVAALGLPAFVKPANMGSSVGVSRAGTAEELSEAIELAASYDRRVIIEEEVVGREIEVAVLGDDEPEASLPGEIRPGADFYDYADKYDDGAELMIPAELTDDEITAAQNLAIRAYRALRVEGLARVDLFLRRPSADGADGAGGTDNRDWVVNEVNTMPGFTPISMYPKLWDVSGLPYPALIDRLVDLAIARHHRRRLHRRTDH